MQSSQQNFNKPVVSATSNQLSRMGNPINIPYTYSDIPQQQEKQQFLLDDIIDKPLFPLAKEKTDNYTSSMNSSQKNIIFTQTSQYQITLPPSIAKPNVVRTQNLRQTISKFDQDIFQLCNLVEKQKQNQSSNRIPSEKEVKNRKTLSRLSQQFFPNPTNKKDESLIKSKRKARRTVAGFGLGLDGKIKAQQFNKNEVISQSQNKINNLVFAKMEVEQFNQHQVKQPPTNEKGTELIQSSSSRTSNFQSNQQKKSIQTRLNEAKIRNQRVSSSVDGILNLLKIMDEDDNIRQSKPKIQNSRVSSGRDALISFISMISDQNQYPPKNQSTNESKSLQAHLTDNRPKQINLAEKARRFTQNFKKPFDPEKVILQDERQDDFTPLKQTNNTGPSNNNQQNKISLVSAKKISQNPQSFSRSKSKHFLDYNKEVFAIFYENIKEKFIEQKKVVEELRRQKSQLEKSNKQALSIFKVDSKKLTEMKKKQHAVSTKIAELKNKINLNDFKEYKKIINGFQLKFGTRLHKYQRTSKSVAKNMMGEGFFAEFSHQDVLFRIKRNEKEDSFMLKFQPYTGLKDESLFSLKFDFDLKTQLYQMYANRGLRKINKFIAFLVNLISYCNAVKQFQLTLEYFTHLYSIENIDLRQASMELEFQMNLGSELRYLWAVDLLRLREDGGITIQNLEDRKHIQIPNELLAWRQKSNKIVNSFIFLKKHQEEQAISKIQSVITNK